MEATCRLAMTVWETDDLAYAKVCGAPIPRLDEGPCEAHVAGVGECLAPRDYWRHGQTVVGNRNHAYIAPLAAECAAGHPVAVQTEAERRG